MRGSGLKNFERETLRRQFESARGYHKIRSSTNRCRSKRDSRKNSKDESLDGGLGTGKALHSSVLRWESARGYLLPWMNI